MPFLFCCFYEPHFHSIYTPFTPLALYHRAPAVSNAVFLPVVDFVLHVTAVNLDLFHTPSTAPSG
jgi:hypothetical protein